MLGREDPDWERRKVRELRDRGVSWQHISAQLGRSQIDLRMLYGQPSAALSVGSAPSPPKTPEPVAKPAGAARNHGAAMGAALLALSAGQRWRACDLAECCGAHQSLAHYLARRGLVENVRPGSNVALFQITQAGRDRLAELIRRGLVVGAP